MPLYMDIHNLDDGMTAEDVGKGLQFEDVGEVALKGFGSPIRAHAAAWKQ